MTKGDVTFPGGSCRAGTSHSHRWSLHSPSTLRAIGSGLAGKAESTVVVDAPRRSVETEASILSFRPGSILRILIGENADHSGSNFVTDDGLVIFANDVNTEFL